MPKDTQDAKQKRRPPGFAHLIALVILGGVLGLIFHGIMMPYERLTDEERRAYVEKVRAEKGEDQEVIWGAKYSYSDEQFMLGLVVGFSGFGAVVWACWLLVETFDHK